MMQRKGTASIWHEKVYHAASACQAASLSLTARRLHGEKRYARLKGKKQAAVLPLGDPG